MKVYHRTPHAQNILVGGFRDEEGHYLTNSIHRGVWFSDQPLDGNQGAKGPTLLSLEIPDDVFEEYEWVQEELGYRESLIPADIANRFGPVVIDDDHFKGCTADSLEKRAELIANSGMREAAERAAGFRSHIDFLRRHGLIDAEGTGSD